MDNQENQQGAPATDAVTTPTPTPTPAPAPVKAAGPTHGEVPVPPAEEAPKADELSMLKSRAQIMGITFSNNIGVDALKQKIAEKLAEESKGDESAPAPVETQTVTQVPVTPAPAPIVTPPAPNPLEQGAEKMINDVTVASPTEPVEAPAPVAKKPESLRARLYRENMRLIRVRVTNLDPKKRDLQGEIFTVANEYLGTVRRFVPFGEASDAGYHIEFVIYKMMLRRKFLDIRTKVNKNTDTPLVKSRWVREFAIEVLDPLTESELKQLGTAQLAAGSIDDGFSDPN